MVRLFRCYPDSACGTKPPVLPLWATCADKDVETVTKAANAIGITGQYSCAKGVLDGACGMAMAPQLCPVTCNLCPWLSAWTFIEGSPKSQRFCLASSQSCDFTTSCGGDVTSASECQTASIELGLNGSVNVLDDIAGAQTNFPRGCFYVQEGSGLYWNANGSQGSSINFAKSICRWQNTSGFTLPEPSRETVDACGETHTLMPVYSIAAQAFDAALAALNNKQVAKFMLRIGEGHAYVHKQISFSGAKGRKVVVLAGARSSEGSVPHTSVNLGGTHIFISSGMPGQSISLCMQDLRLHNGKADKIGEEGGKSTELATHSPVTSWLTPNLYQN